MGQTTAKRALFVGMQPVLTQMSCEGKAEKEFKLIATETYLPVQEEIHE